MFADISHERQQSLLRQRNLFALTSAGLAVALAVTTSLAATLPTPRCCRTLSALPGSSR